MPNIEVTATGNVQPAVASLEKLDKALENVAKASQDTSSALAKIPAATSNVSKSLATTAVAASKADSALGNLKPGANQAGQALVNLGRVAQDAPFGFIGIQNNINPLLESFQRLKAETGSTKGALSALGSSLLGAGGLGLAVSVATGLLTVLAQNGFFKTGEAAEKAKEKIKGYSDFLKDAAASVAQEQTDVLGFIGVLKSETETRERRLGAIKELQRIQPEIFAGLKLEQGAVIGLDAAYTAYVANLKNVIQSKIIQATIEAKLTRLLQLQQALGEGNNVTTLSQIKNLKILSETEQAVAKDREKLTNNAPLFGLGIKVGQGKAEANVLKGEIDDLIKKLFDLSKTIKVPVDTIKIKPKKVEVESLPKIDGIFKNVQGFKPEFKIDTKLVIKPTLTLDGGERAEIIRQLQDVGIKDIARDVAIGLPVKVNLENATTDELKGRLEKLLALVQEFQTKVKDVLQNVVTNTVVGFSDALGNALSSGKFDVPNLFGGIISSLGSQIQDLGKFLIQSAITIKLAKEAFKKLLANPVAAALVGAGLVILGGVLKAQASKKYQGFATGGVVPSSNTILVGERGPETLTVPGGSRIGTNGQLNAMRSGAMNLTGEFIVRGTDLVYVLNKATAYNSRNGF